MRLRSPTLIALLTAAGLAGPGYGADVPGLIPYQGRVQVSGVNINGTADFKFALVDAAGTTAFWSNDGTGAAGTEPASAVSLTVTNGLFSLLLGDVTLNNMTAVPPTAVAATDVRLKVWVKGPGQTVFTALPATRLGSSPFALKAATVQDGAIGVAQLAAAAPLTGQVLSFNGTSLEWTSAASGGTGLVGPQGPVGATGPQGPAGLTGAQGPAGVTGPQGPSGSQGLDGAMGLQGPAGLNGSSWSSGVDVPSDANGTDGDFYLVTGSGAVYRRAAGVWGTPIATLVGPQGAAGNQGPQGPPGIPGNDGPVGPQGPAGSDATGEVEATHDTVARRDGSGGLKASVFYGSGSGLTIAKDQVQLGNVQNTLHNLNAVGSPWDSLIPANLEAGYTSGSLWVDTAASTMWLNTGEVEGDPSWVQIANAADVVNATSDMVNATSDVSSSQAPYTIPRTDSSGTLDNWISDMQPASGEGGGERGLVPRPSSGMAVLTGDGWGPAIADSADGSSLVARDAAGGVHQTSVYQQVRTIDTGGTPFFEYAVQSDDAIVLVKSPIENRAEHQGTIVVTLPAPASGRTLRFKSIGNPGVAKLFTSDSLVYVDATPLSKDFRNFTDLTNEYNSSYCMGGAYVALVGDGLAWHSIEGTDDMVAYAPPPIISIYQVPYYGYPVPVGDPASIVLKVEPNIFGSPHPPISLNITISSPTGALEGSDYTFPVGLSMNSLNVISSGSYSTFSFSIPTLYNPESLDEYEDLTVSLEASLTGAYRLNVDGDGNPIANVGTFRVNLLR